MVPVAEPVVAVGTVAAVVGKPELVGEAVEKPVELVGEACFHPCSTQVAQLG